MKKQYIPREEIEKYWEYDKVEGLPKCDEFVLTEDGYVYAVGGDGHAIFDSQIFPYEPENFQIICE